jgi:hypothetical protein
LEFTQDIEGEQSACLRALQTLKELNATGRRINGEIDRRAWECALLLKLRHELKAGNLSVQLQQNGSRGWRSSSSTTTVG